MPIEGTQTIIVRDAAGLPFANASILIDAIHYRTDETGSVTLRLTRGTHTIRIQSPGYNPVETTIVVRGRAILVARAFGSLKI